MIDIIITLLLLAAGIACSELRRHRVRGELQRSQGFLDKRQVGRS